MQSANSTERSLRDRLDELVAFDAWRAPVERHLAGLGLELRSGRATYVRVRPPEMALLGFEVEGRGRANPLIGYLGLLPDWRIEQALEQMRHWRHGRLVDHVNADPVAGCLVCTLPADRRLRGAATVVDPQMLAKSIRRSLPAGANGKLRPRPDQTVSKPVSYKPERRLVCQVVTTLENDGDSALRLYARSYAEPRAQRAVEEAQALCSEPGLAEHVRLAQPLGWDRRGYVAYFLELAGTRFDDLDADSARTAWRAAGGVLARLHRITPRVEWVLDGRAALRRVEATLAGLGFASPTVGDRAQRLSRAMLAAPPPVRTSALVHGDFYSKQLLWDGERPAVLDYDDLAAGDPAADLANALAHAEVNELRGRAALPAVAVRDALLAGYGEAGGVLPTPADLRWFGVWALLELSVWPFRSLKPDFEERCADVVHLAERAWRGEGLWSPPS